MLGVCCQCQEEHSVRSSSRNRDDLDFMEDMILEGPSAGYVMAAHDPTFGGGPCERAGTTPQAVFPEEP